MSMGILIVLILVLLIILLLIGCYIYFRRRIREFSQKVFNTPNIMDGFKRLEIEYQETPKSLSSLNSVMVPKILKDFPELNVDEIKKVAENSILAYYEGINNKRIVEKYYMSEHFIDLVKKQISLNETSDIKFDRVRIHGTVINAYDNRKGSCIITFQSAIEYCKVGSKGKVKEQKRVNTEMIYIYDDTLVKDAYGVSLNCHNCGAPIKMLGIKSCPYCGTGIVEYLKKTWKVNNIYEK